MNGRILKSARTVAVLLLIIGGVFSIVPGGATAGTGVGSCIADANGHFPAAVLGCSITIPADTAPGEYNLVATCATASGAAAPYPPGPTSSGTLGVSSNRVNAGQTITASGDGCAPNAIVSFSLDRIGALALGGLRLSGVAEAQTGTRTLTARITVLGAVGKGGTVATSGGASNTNTAGGGTLARTGIDVVRYLLVAGTAIGLGTVLVGVGRRRTAKKGSTPAL